MTLRSTLVILALSLAPPALARAALPPYDFTGHWSGTIAVGLQVIEAAADLTTAGARAFSGAAVANGVTCTVRGKRKRKVVVRLVCEDGTRARLTGILDPASDAVAGVARLLKRHHRTSGTFILARASAPVCGNGGVEPGEECDDGNVVAGDGCSPTCTVETLADVTEIEPNGAPVNATEVPTLPALVQGTVNAGGDQDFFKIAIAGSDLFLETFDAGGPGSCGPDTDTVLELRGPDGETIVAIDDDGGIGPCSRLELHGLAPGVYYPCVRSFSSVPAYRLRIVAP